MVLGYFLSERKPNIYVYVCVYICLCVCEVCVLGVTVAQQLSYLIYRVIAGMK